MNATPHLAMGHGAEFDAIRQLLVAWGTTAVGIGDDAAIMDVPAGEKLVVSTDASIEGVHFLREWLSAEEIGARAASAALSDLAAMAATPRGLLLALGLPPAWRNDLEAIAAGVGAVASRARCPIVGGNIAAATELSLTITVLGSAAKPLRRDGAVAGDIVYVTGKFGGPGAALRAWLRGDVPHAEHRARFARPVPRIAEAILLAESGAHAAIDISDGLMADAAHLARASGVSVVIDIAAIPCVSGVSAEESVVSGEEYELLVAMPRSAAVDVSAFALQFGVPLTPVGMVVDAGPDAVMLSDGGVVPTSGHDHLA
ncbi:MAG: thiamine-phosphate kinase [bacterium]